VHDHDGEVEAMARAEQAAEDVSEKARGEMEDLAERLGEVSVVNEKEVVEQKAEENEEESGGGGIGGKASL
jgi:hypothetical protein